jgi:hypothetical protein
MNRPSIRTTSRSLGFFVDSSASSICRSSVRLCASPTPTPGMFENPSTASAAAFAACAPAAIARVCCDPAVASACAYTSFACCSAASIGRM